MNARIEAAAKVINQRSVKPMDWDDPRMRSYRFNREYDAKLILAAADAVMFSDEAIERAAKALNAEHAPAWEILPDWVKEDWRKQVRTVVAALKGEA